MKDLFLSLNMISLKLRQSFLVFSGVLVVSGLFLTSLQAQEQKNSGNSGEKPAIKVGPNTLSKKEFQKRVDQQMKQVQKQMPNKRKKGKPGKAKMKKMVRDQVKQRTVEQMILSLHADKSDVEISEDEVENRWKEFVKRVGSEKRLKKRLKKIGRSIDEFRDEIKKNLKIKKFIDSEIPDHEVSDKEVRQFYKKNKRRFGKAKFKQVKDRIKKQLKQRKEQKAVKKLVKELRQKTEVQVNV